MLSCRIIILNYNGKQLLRNFLPSEVASAKASRYPCHVTVVDNASSDGSGNFVKTEFSEVELVCAAKNKVLCSYNDAVRQAQEDVVALLNNAIKT